MAMAAAQHQHRPAPIRPDGRKDIDARLACRCPRFARADAGKAPLRCSLARIHGLPAPATDPVRRARLQVAAVATSPSSSCRSRGSSKAKARPR